MNIYHFITTGPINREHSRQRILAMGGRILDIEVQEAESPSDWRYRLIYVAESPLVDSTTPVIGETNTNPSSGHMAHA